jgi:hypothetical protein
LHSRANRLGHERRARCLLPLVNEGFVASLAEAAARTFVLCETAFHGAHHFLMPKGTAQAKAFLTAIGAVNVKIPIGLPPIVMLVPPPR